MYPSLLGSGFLDRLLQKGVKYLFVSNSDNLGATLDVDLLAYFAKTDKAFIMEASAESVQCMILGAAVRLNTTALLQTSVFVRVWNLDELITIVEKWTVFAANTVLLPLAAICSHLGTSPANREFMAKGLFCQCDSVLTL